MDKEHINDDRFLANLKKGEVKSFHQLYDSIAPSMRLVCKRYVKTDADAEDVFHEGFLKVYQHIGTLKNAEAFYGWLKRIFINTSLDYYKKSNDGKADYINYINELKLSTYEENIVDIDDLHPNELNYQTISKVDFSQDEMLDALKRIPEHFRVVFQLFVIDDCKHQEIAELLSINEKTSKTRLLRARGLIKVELLKLATQKLSNGQTR